MCEVKSKAMDCSGSIRNLHTRKGRRWRPVTALHRPDTAKNRMLVRIIGRLSGQVGEHRPSEGGVFGICDYALHRALN